MSPQKFHIGKNGPAPCKVRVRVCEFEVQGTEAEVNAVWEKQQEELFGDSMLAGATKAKQKPVNDVEDKNRKIAAASLSERSSYNPRVYDVEYIETEKDVAMKLALSNMTPLSYNPVMEEDEEWSSNGETSVRRYEFENGNAGYFKSLQDNSEGEYVFEMFQTNSLAASISEVNAYRMSQALGDSFSKLVPETVIRQVDGSMGTLQREVNESLEVKPDYGKHEGLRDDFRKAAIFDFAIGNMDRHGGNFLYGTHQDEGSSVERPAIRLIDNSFSFPRRDSFYNVNRSIFSNNEGTNFHPWNPLPASVNYTIPPKELTLEENEVEALKSARASVQSWISAGTISEGIGNETVGRIDHMLESKRIGHLESYLGKLGDAQELIEMEARQVERKAKIAAQILALDVAIGESK